MKTPSATTFPSDEAADNGYEIQDEDDVFGLLNDLGSDSDSAGDEE